MRVENLTVQELINILSQVEDKTKVIEVYTNCVKGVDVASEFEELESSVLIG